MLSNIHNKLRPSGARLVAVSKTQPPDAILELYRQGQRVFGENRAQELAAKYQALPKDIEWHLIGHLQTNKVKLIAPFVSCIQSVDSRKLLDEINRQALKNDRTIDCLLQFHLAQEETKFGLTLAEAEALVGASDFFSLQNVRITGVMGMATLTDDEVQVRREFQELKSIFEQLKSIFFQTAPSFREVSMGMSGDYQAAVEEGSTMVRIGTLLFGGLQH